MALFTIGHSTRPAEEFLELLREHDIKQVVDVRRIPGSNKHPQFNADSLTASLNDAGIGYEHAEALAGRRRVSKTLAIMCSEAVWWRCHRRIIADHLLAHGDTVRHILGVAHVDEARLSEGAQIEGTTVTYPTPASRA